MGICGQIVIITSTELGKCAKSCKITSKAEIIQMKNILKFFVALNGTVI